MAWNSRSAVNAYLDTIKFCKQRKSTNAEPDISEYISALAAGMNAKLIVQVCSAASTSTIGLAAAARHTGGRLICILPEARALPESQKALKEVGLQDGHEFVVGDAKELLPKFKNVDFSVIDCKTEDCDYAGLFKELNVNSSSAVVVASNLFDTKAAAPHWRAFKRKVGAKSTSLPIAKGVEVTRIGNNNNNNNTSRYNSVKGAERAGSKSRWIVHVDKDTGEEHFFRVGTVKPHNKSHFNQSKKRECCVV